MGIDSSESTTVGNRTKTIAHDNPPMLANGHSAADSRLCLRRIPISAGSGSSSLESPAMTSSSEKRRIFMRNATLASSTMRSAAALETSRPSSAFLYASLNVFALGISSKT